MNFLRSCMSYACPYDPVDLQRRRQQAGSPANGKYWERQRSPSRDVKGADTYVEALPIIKDRAFALPCRLSRYSLSCPICRLRCLKRKLKQWVVSEKAVLGCVRSD